MTTGAQLKDLFLAPWRVHENRGIRQGCVECKLTPYDIPDADDDTSDVWEIVYCACKWDNSPAMWRRLEPDTQKDIIAAMLIAKRAGVPRDVAKLISLRVGEGRVPPLTYEAMRKRAWTVGDATVAVATGLVPLFAQFLSAFAGTLVVGHFGLVGIGVAKNLLDSSDGSPGWLFLVVPMAAGIMASVLVWMGNVFVKWLE